MGRNPIACNQYRCGFSIVSSTSDISPWPFERSYHNLAPLHPINDTVLFNFIKNLPMSGNIFLSTDPFYSRKIGNDFLILRAVLFTLLEGFKKRWMR